MCSFEETASINNSDGSINTLTNWVEALKRNPNYPNHTALAKGNFLNKCRENSFFTSQKVKLQTSFSIGTNLASLWLVGKTYTATLNSKIFSLSWIFSFQSLHQKEVVHCLNLSTLLHHSSLFCGVTFNGILMIALLDLS